MNKLYTILLGVLTISTGVFAQSNSTLIGQVKDAKGEPLTGISVSLYKAKDSALLKASFTNVDGFYQIESNDTSLCYLSFTGMGLHDENTAGFSIGGKDTLSFPVTVLTEAAKTIGDVVVTARKPMIEVKADKVVFNVESSINATGNNALELLGKSPGVLVDNNESISMKGKNGVKIYIDGKMTQLDSKSLADYLKSINSSDIEAIEMIANPGAKYDASGNAGIINIRLKKNKKLGTNGSAELGFSQGKNSRGSASGNFNYRDEKLNVFGNLGAYAGSNDNELGIYRVQNDTVYDQHTNMRNSWNSMNLKAGADYFINRKNTIGVLMTSNISKNTFQSSGYTDIYYPSTDNYIKKLISSNDVPGHHSNSDLNLNYRFSDTTGTEIGFDADYGRYRSVSESRQPNMYFNSNGELIQTIINGNKTPTNIDIYTAKLDIENKLGKGKLGYGLKTAYVKTDNSFSFYDYTDNRPVINLTLSNSFLYKEQVNAAYVNYNIALSKKWSLQAGLRSEQTISSGDLTRADGIVQAEQSVKRSYIDFFPSGALSYNANEQNAFGLVYSRRIDRPNYQDLNPFENKLDQLTYEKGNPFLKPQYTDNIELNHTFKSKLVTSVSYSYVKDYAVTVTDTINGNASYLQKRNLANQQIISFNIGSSFTVTKWWSGYANAWYMYQFINGNSNETPVKFKSPGYGLYAQNTFMLGHGFTGELSGWFAGKGLEQAWTRKALGSVDIGVQKKFWNDKASFKVSVTDVFRTTRFKAVSDYGGVYLRVNQMNENRMVKLVFNYRFGNNQVKAARQHKSGLESESNRIK